MSNRPHKHKGDRGRALPREWSPWVAVPPELARLALPLAARAVALELHYRACRAWQTDPDQRSLSRVPFEASTRDLARTLHLATSTVSDAMGLLCDPRTPEAWFVLDAPGFGGRPLKGRKVVGRSMYRVGPGHPWCDAKAADRRRERFPPVVVGGAS